MYIYLHACQYGQKTDTKFSFFLKREYFRERKENLAVTNAIYIWIKNDIKGGKMLPTWYFWRVKPVSWDFKVKINNKSFYDRGFCYPISHERISGELAICCNKNPKSLEVNHILFTAVYFNGQQQTEYHYKPNNTKIKHNN
jgi:hypothetical protein